MLPRSRAYWPAEAIVEWHERCALMADGRPVAGLASVEADAEEVVRIAWRVRDGLSSAGARDELGEAPRPEEG